MNARVWVDSDGRTHIEDMGIPMAGLEPQEARVVFGIRPPGFVQDWHNAMCPMYIITLGGEMEVEVESGETRRFRAGDVRLEQDLTGRGHVSRVIGSQPWSFAVILLEQASRPRRQAPHR